MSKIIVLAALLSAVGVGAAQAQNLTIPAGDAGFGQTTAPAARAPVTQRPGFQALASGRTSHRVVYHRLDR